MRERQKEPGLERGSNKRERALSICEIGINLLLNLMLKSQVVQPESLVTLQDLARSIKAHKIRVAMSELPAELVGNGAVYEEERSYGERNRRAELAALFR